MNLWFCHEKIQVHESYNNLLKQATNTNEHQLFKNEWRLN